MKLFETIRKFEDSFSAWELVIADTKNFSGLDEEVTA